MSPKPDDVRVVLMLRATRPGAGTVSREDPAGSSREESGTTTMLNKLNTLKARRTRGAFSLVEILIVILIIAVLMAVAIPNLLSSRSSGIDSAAKQLIQKAQTELVSYQTRVESFPAETDQTSATHTVGPDIKFEAASTGSSLIAGTNARSVSYKKVSDTEMVIAVKGADTTCWAMWVASNGTQYLGSKSMATCSADNAKSGTGWVKYAFPSDAS